MMKTAAVATALLLLAPFGASAQQTVDPNLAMEVVHGGMNQPTAYTFIGPNQILACEKPIGVRLINTTNQPATWTRVLAPPDLFSVNEAGMLGIAIDPQFTQNGFVYLFYSTRNALNQYQDDRVMRYRWDGAQLVEPFGPLWTCVADPTQPNGPNHHGGVIRVGPDGKLYIAMGDLNRTRLEQNQPGTATSGSGAIYRINLDGSVPADNPFSNDIRLDVRRLFAYGVRNCFGLAFDPVTGKLWDTENGETSYDEINLVEPGFNSGWRPLMGPDSRDPQSAADLNMLSGAHYSDPEFSWAMTTAPTGLAFLESPKFSAVYRNRLVVADTRDQNLYALPLNAARDGFALNGVLADLVADTPEERYAHHFAFGIGGPVDLQIGPDGFLYFASVYNGRLSRIRPRFNPAEISGQVSLAEWSGAGAGQTVELTLMEGDRPLERLIAVVGADGRYRVSTPTLGAWRVVARSAPRLSIDLGTITINGNVSLNLAFGATGDTDANDSVDDADLTNLILDFGGPAANGQTDLNGDGVVDDADLTALILYFGLTGPAGP